MSLEARGKGCVLRTTGIILWGYLLRWHHSWALTLTDTGSFSGSQGPLSSYKGFRNIWEFSAPCLVTFDSNVPVPCPRASSARPLPWYVCNLELNTSLQSLWSHLWLGPPPYLPPNSRRWGFLLICHLDFLISSHALSLIFTTSHSSHCWHFWPENPLWWGLSSAL